MATVAFDSSTSTVNKNAGTKAIAVSLSAPAPAGGCSVQYNTADVTANSTTYGMGKNYDAVVNGTLSFAENEQTKNITITIENNPLFNIDLTFTVTLSSPTNCTLGATTVNTCTIQDNLAPYILDVTDADGSLTAVSLDACVGDGTTDDTVNFQAILDYLKGNGGGVVYVPTGKTLLLTPTYNFGGNMNCVKVPCQQQITIAGDGHENSGFLAAVWTTSNWHFFNASKDLGYAAGGYGWSHVSDDSPGLCFFGVKIDGNGPNQPHWGYWDYAPYHPEYNFMILANAYPGANYTNAGRMKIIFHGCKLQNSTSDGLSADCNCKAIVYNTDGLDCTRGVVDIIGGYTDVNIRGGSFYSSGDCYKHDTEGGLTGPTHDISIHLEVMPGSEGYGGSSPNSGSYVSDITVNDFACENQLCLLEGYQPAAGTWILNNVTQSGYGWYGIKPRWGATINLTNSTFLKRWQKVNTDWNFIGEINGPVTLTGCTFKQGLNSDNTWSITDPITTYRGSPLALYCIDGAPTLTIENCTLTVDTGYEVQPGTAGAFFDQLDSSSNGSFTINITNPTVDSKLNGGFIFRRIGGTTTVDGGTYSGNDTTAVDDYAGCAFRFISVGANAAFHAILKNINMITGTGRCIALQYNPTVASTLDLSQNFTVSAALNKVYIYPAWASMTNWDVTGGRHIMAPNNTPPTENTHGFPDDRYYLQNGDYYICTQIAYNYASVGEVAGAAWDGPYTPASLHSRGAYLSLPAGDADLETLYTVDDATDVATDDTDMVGQLAVSKIAIHQFKQEILSAGGIINVVAQVTIPCSTSTAYLQIYNRSGTPAWDTIDSDNATGANTDFPLSATVADLTDYKDENNIVACRVYQEMQ